MDRIIIRLARRLLTRGTHRAIDTAARRGQDTGSMTDAERAQAKAGRTMARNARKALRLGRRIGRF